MSKDNKEIFEGKTFQDLTKDIYENTTKRKVQIDLLISEIHGFIQTIDDVVMVAPIIKEYMDTAVKNDEHLVKLAGVLQRIISKSQGESDESMLLSDAEKEAVFLISDYISRYRNRSQVNTSTTFTTMQTALNALSGHYKTFANRPVPENLKERLNKELSKAEKLAVRDN